MKKKLFSLFFLLAALAFSHELHIDLSNIDPLFSAVFRGVEEAFAVNEKGLEALQSGDFEEAKRLFEQASTMIPIYSDARNNLGIAYFRSGREAQAAEIWRNVAASDPDYAFAWFNLGLFHFRAGELEEALQMLERAYSEVMNNEEIWTLFSYVLTQSGQIDKAKAVLETKIPAHGALRMLGEIHAVSGNFETARSYLERLRAFNSPDRVFFETLAAVYNELKEFEKTLQLFNEAESRRDRISANFRVSYAWALYETGEKERASAIFRRLLAQNPDDRRAKISLMYILISNRQFDEARMILEQIAVFEGESFGLQYLRGFTDLESMRFEESLKSLERAVELAPENRAARELLGYALINIGDEARAQEIWRALSFGDNPSAQSLINLAVLAERRNMPDSALYYFEKSLEVAENAGVRVSMGNIFFDQDRFDLALVNYTLAFADEEWRAKALSGAYFTALRMQDAPLADNFFSLFDDSDEGDYVVRARSDYFLRRGDLERSRELIHSVSQPLEDDIFRLVWVNLLLNDIEAAQEAVETAKRMGADETQTAMMAQQIALASGDFTAARAQETAISKEREAFDVNSLFNLALNYHIAGDIQRAMELYEEVLAKDKNFRKAWNNIGAIYGGKGEIQRAVAAYRNAARRRAGIIDGYVNLVNIFYATGDRRSAARWLRRGLRREPDNENLLRFRELLAK